jgi:hypothetical protein
MDIVLTTALNILVEKKKNMLRRHFNVSSEPWTTKKSEIRPIFYELTNYFLRSTTANGNGALTGQAMLVALFNL